MKKVGFAFFMCVIVTMIVASLSAQAQAQIALLHSDNTITYFRNAYPDCSPPYYETLGADEYERYFGGWSVVLDEAGLAYDVIKDKDIRATELRRFKVLILSNNFWLERAQTKVIAEWVRKGGRLLTTFGTGYSGTNGDFWEGGTNALHELWGAPSGKVNSSYYLNNPWVKIQISKNGGPTAGFAVGKVLDYQYMANLLIQRPLSSRDINAFFVFDDKATRYPAIFNNRHSRGLVIYYAFAPEYLVSLDSDVAGHCADDLRYEDNAWLDAVAEIAAPLKDLMKQTLYYLLNQ